MIVIRKTDSSNKDFQSLVEELDKELTMLDKEAHSMCAQLTKLNQSGMSL